MCHHCVAASLEQPCKAHSPRSGCRRLKYPLVYLFLHPSIFMGPHSPSAAYLRSGPVQRGTWRLLAGSSQSSSPPISVIRGSLCFPWRPSEICILASAAAQLTRQLAHPHGRPARKTSILVMILEKKSFLDFCLRRDTVHVYADWKYEASLSALSWGGTSGELGCRESFITAPTPAGCQVREAQPQREQLISTDTA